MKPLELKTVDDRVRHVLAAHGKAPVVMRAMDAAEREQFAALCSDAGALVPAAGPKFRQLLIEHYERLKATDEELEQEAAADATPEPEGE